MLQVFSCITEQHDLRLVFLAGLICLFATYTTFSLTDRARNANPKSRSSWLAAAGIALGCGVWATHFVAMLAYHPHTHMTYDWDRTILSIVIAIFSSGFGLAIARRNDIVSALVGGLIVGGGIGAMHYVGMAAVNTSGTLRYDTMLVFASLAVGAILAAVSTLIYQRHSDWIGHLCAATVLTLSICGLHFTGMTALTVIADPNMPMEAQAIESSLLSIAIAAVTILILTLSLIGSLIDQHLASRSAQEANRLRTSEARFRQLADATFEGVVIHFNGSVIDANSAMCRMLGRSLDSLAGCSVFDFIHADSLPRVQDRLESPSDTALEIDLLHADGSPIPVEILGQAIDHQGNEARVVAVRDLRDRKSSERRIRHMAHHDMLTGLPNRILFHDRLHQALALAQRNGQNVAVLCLDLDRFKNVNDLLGHHGGDQLLKSVAERLIESVRAHDTVARLSGDEFAIIQIDAVQPESAGLLAERIIEAIGQPFKLEGQQMLIGTSIGIALYPNDGADGEALVRSADTALYRAKESGRRTFRFFESEMDLQRQERSKLEQELRAALTEGNQLELYYQPLYDCESSVITGCEALVRWRHPTRGQISPADFIPLAEESGLIVPLGKWVLATACRAAAQWPEHMRVAVNLSPAQFRHAELTRDVLATLQQANLPAHRLELEITEGVLIEDTEHTLATLKALKSHGIRISLDDFGTGYSSLSYLQRFPFDKIKIDRSFVWQMENNTDSMAIVRAVIALGHSLRIAVTAEGVENAEQLSLLQSENCDQVQGFYLGRPQPHSEFEKLLNKLEPQLQTG
ncbi:MAG: EAL domain-containing protein [Spongiibacteraceae bacterium]